MNKTMVATELLAKIESSIFEDQGNAYRKFLGELMPTLDDAYRESKYKFRPHMGASLQGNQCARAIWYSFRWATIPSFSGRIMRLFNRGHLEEARFIAALRCAGAMVWQYDAAGKQYGIKGSYGHYGGSGDGLAANLPGLAPNTYAVCEFKTHSSKSFAELLKKGLLEAKWEHYVQMQQYMFKFKYPVALYMAVNKDNDDLHAEYVALDSELAAKVIDRADKIIWLTTPPPQIGSPPSAGNFQCRYCDHKPVCHAGAVPAKNCRTCVYSEPLKEGDPIWGPPDGGVWSCRLHGGAKLNRDVQEAGCGSWDPIKL